MDMMSTAKIELNVTQARKLAELLNKADWHGSRDSLTVAIGYLNQAEDIMRGVRVPEDENHVVALLHAQMGSMGVESSMGESQKRLFFSRLSGLRALSIQALEHVELALYTPRSATARAETI